MGRGKLQNHVRPEVASIETSTMSGIHLDRLEGVTSMGKDLQDGQSWHAIPLMKNGRPVLFFDCTLRACPVSFPPRNDRIIQSWKTGLALVASTHAPRMGMAAE